MFNVGFVQIFNRYTFLLIFLNQFYVQTFL